MNVGRRATHGTTNFYIGIASILRMDSALKANLRSAAIPRLRCPTFYFIDVENVWFAAQLFACAPLRECAKRTFVFADIRVIDVSVYDVSNVVANGLGAHIVCGCTNLVDRAFACFKELYD